jgi:hypothetical protein
MTTALRLTVLAALLAGSPLIHADKRAPSSLAPDLYFDRTVVEDEERSGKALVGAGAVLLFLGAAGTATGAGLMLGAPPERYFAGSIAAFTLGTASAAIGTVLMAVGGHKLHEAKQARIAITARGLSF